MPEITIDDNGIINDRLLKVSIGPLTGFVAAFGLADDAADATPLALAEALELLDDQAQLVEIAYGPGATAGLEGSTFNVVTDFEIIELD